MEALGDAFVKNRAVFTGNGMDNAGALLSMLAGARRTNTVLGIKPQ